MSFFSKLSTKMNAAATTVSAKISEVAEKGSASIDKAVANQKETTPSGQVFNQDYAGECTRAAAIINQFIIPDPTTGGLDNTIPMDVISKCKGLAILQVARAGMGISGRYGSGIVIAKLEDGTWSAPMSARQLGVGFQIGGDITDFVMVLNTVEAVKAFSQGGDIKVGGSLSVAAGPVGRSAEASASLNYASPVFSYSKSKGLFAGASLDGSAVMEGKEQNEKFYGRVIGAQELLSGSVERPAVAAALYQALETRVKQEAAAAAAVPVPAPAASA
ncbi:DUF500-domain-containing protein [Rhizoclosmatium globosum]|uniref:DUF500-domain-containing protein n=1 Tax=Rhizoclosmatium globosum TaxID=329046 RepID=A0A1Y2CUI7_9FUNG|nr:DUF500-domain-containing protein [Rhizoclosmatium globosum]|eukprot:ORY50556.1 DUF500-domain-containing protein [Rhizoclosmatium globosum]